MRPQDPKGLAQLSVQDRAEVAFRAEAPLVFFLARVADEIPTPKGKARDRALDTFWKTEPYLAGAIYSMCAKVAALDYTLKGPKKSVARYKTMFMSSDLGTGWVTFIQKVILDLATQDNGACIELLRRKGDGPSAPVRGIAHLDSNRCLGRDTRVLMADGSRKPILDLVRERSQEEVMALDNHGNLVPRPIIGWYETKLNDRYWLRIKLAGAQYTFGRREGLWATNDHEILTPGGWKRADELSVGDKVVTKYPSPSFEQQQIILGAVLGDGHLRKQSARGRPELQLGQGKDQEGWLRLKMTSLEGLGWSPVRESRNSFGSVCKHAGCHVTPALERTYDEAYGSGRRKVPRELVEEHFGPRLLAVWYGDDGSMMNRKWGRLPTRLYTNSFPQEDVEWLVELLIKHGIESKVAQYTQQSGKKEPFIYVTSDGAEVLYEMVAPYLPSCLRHKLPEDAEPFDPNKWNIDLVSCYADTIVEISEGTNGDQTTAFCLDVEDLHNFVAADMIVHNCYRTGDVSAPVKYLSRHDNKYHNLKWFQVIPMADMPSTREEDKGQGHCAVSRVLKMAQILRDISLLKRQKMGGKQVPGKIFFVSGIRRGAVEAALNEAYEMQRSEGYTHYTKPVILTAPDPMTPVAVNEIELAGLPDNYNEDDTLKWYITALALAFGTDYTEFAPLPGGNLGSGMQTAEMAARARGKGPGVLIQQLEYAFNWFVLPSTIEFQFSSTDPTAERDRIELRTMRARERSMRIQSGELTAEQARRLAVMEGDAPEELFAEEYQEEIEAGVQEIELIIRSLRASYAKVEKSLIRVKVDGSSLT